MDLLISKNVTRFCIYWLLQLLLLWLLEHVIFLIGASVQSPPSTFKRLIFQCKFTSFCVRSANFNFRINNRIHSKCLRCRRFEIWEYIGNKGTKAHRRIDIFSDSASLYPICYIILTKLDMDREVFRVSCFLPRPPIPILQESFPFFSLCESAQVFAWCFTIMGLIIDDQYPV